MLKQHDFISKLGLDLIASMYYHKKFRFSFRTAVKYFIYFKIDSTFLNYSYHVFHANIGVYQKSYDFI